MKIVSEWRILKWKARLQAAFGHGDCLSGFRSVPLRLSLRLAIFVPQLLQQLLTFGLLIITLHHECPPAT